MKVKSIDSNPSTPLSELWLIPTIILLLYAFVDLFRIFDIVPLNLANVFYVILGSTSIIYTFIKEGLQKQVFIFLLFYTFSGAVGVVINGNINIQELLWPFAFMGISILILRYEINIKFANILYYTVIFIFIGGILFSGGIDNLSLSVSRNTVGIIVLFYFSVFAISSYNNNIKISLVPLLLGLITTILAIGRSGILTFLLLVILFLLFRFNGKGYKVRNPIKIILLAIITLLLLWGSYDFLENYFSQTITNFQNRGLESIRSIIWEEYINKTLKSVQFILFGAPIGGTLLLNDYDNNLHNSFLMLHAKYGIGVLGVVLALILNAFVHFIKTKNVIFSILLFALIFRMQFDYTNFNAQMDIILFYLMFYPFTKKSIYEGLE